MHGKVLRRKDDRIIIHFDYDCFYASVFEAANPSLKSLPLAVQQKQIIVTCNYEARRRGLRKLQLITDAKRICPDVVIVLGEDLTRFRDASKELYNLLRSFSWSDKVERLGFDEVWMDVTDIIRFNIELLNSHDFQNAFFHLSKLDPTVGFGFDASRIAGNTYPQDRKEGLALAEESLWLRLMLGSHLALHLRQQLEEQKGYTSTVGISTSKLLSKLVGNLNKPKGQTTLVPPYETNDAAADGFSHPSNVLGLLDQHDVGSVPWIGFKLARNLRDLALGRPAKIEEGLIYGPPKEKVTVDRFRKMTDLSPEMLDKALTAPGTPHGIGLKVYSLLHGVDDSEVTNARNVPKQISLEDSYIRLDTMEQVVAQLRSLSSRLIERMHMDLTEGRQVAAVAVADQAAWLARPTTARLSTRPRLPLREDGTRARSFKRISRSCALPSFVFSLDTQAAEIAERLVNEVWLPLFKKLHPESTGWNLSLINIAVTGMEEQQTLGADIGSMFRMQQNTAIPNYEEQALDDSHLDGDVEMGASEDSWQEEEGDEEDLSNTLHEGFTCGLCGFNVPFFAQDAHQRFHDLSPLP